MIELNDWQGMMSAPDDGRVVLLCDEHGNRWTDVSPGCTYAYNGCGYPPIAWTDLPPPAVKHGA